MHSLREEAAVVAERFVSEAQQNGTFFSPSVFFSARGGGGSQAPRLRGAEQRQSQPLSRRAYSKPLILYIYTHVADVIYIHTGKLNPSL